MELGEESYYHLIVQVDSSGDQSSLLWQCVDCGDRILNNNSVYDDGESIVEHPYEKIPFDACYGRGVVGSPFDYSDCQWAHADELHGASHYSKNNL